MRWVLVAALSVGLSAGATAAQTFWGAASTRVDEAMTEQDVIANVGSRPSSVTLETCGQTGTGAPWPCKIFTYGSSASGLRIYFRRQGTSWTVDQWHMLPQTETKDLTLTPARG